jgi:hypothetical protein
MLGERVRHAEGISGGDETSVRKSTGVWQLLKIAGELYKKWTVIGGDERYIYS